MKRHLRLLLTVLCGYNIACQAQPLLSASTESPAPNERMPSAALARAVIAAAGHDDIESIDACMADKKVAKGAYQRVLRMVELPGVRPGEQLFFVRPALKPYCMTFYGAHLFRYWRVARQAATTRFVIRYAGAADAFEVLSSTTNGQHDIAETGCTATSCITAIQKFTDNRYVPVQCRETTTDDKGKTSEKTVECVR